MEEAVASLLRPIPGRGALRSCPREERVNPVGIIAALMPPPSAIRIRPFRIADYATVHALWRRTEGVGLGESDDRKAIGRFIRRNPDLSLVATSGGSVIGAVLCGHDGRRGYLHHLAVARRWRRRGIGRTLVAACLERLREQGIPKCNLFLFTRNVAGRGFWRHLGWNVRADLRLVQRGTASSAGPCRRSC
jgi:putative acetyltransferase